MRIGMFTSEYTKLTLYLLQHMLTHDKIIPVTLESVSENNKQTLDILAIHHTPNGIITPLCTCEAAVVNMDDKKITQFLRNAHARTVTYGFNTKASVTASSSFDGKLVICVQRALQTLKGDMIWPQEFAVETETAVCGMRALALTPPEGEEDVFVTECILFATAVALTAGADLERFSINGCV